MNLTKGANLYDAFLEVASGTCEYLSNWTYDSPLVVSAKTNDWMRTAQKLMVKSIRYFVENYDDYKHLMPVSEKVDQILTLCKQKAYRPGTYRTDFVIDENNQIKLIEITCRFALNGFFTSGYTHLMADRYLENKPDIKKIDDYTPYYDYLMSYFGEFDHVCLLKGADNRNETKSIIPIFEKAGYQVHVIPADAVGDHLHLLKDAAVIGELDHTEICNLPMEAIEAIIGSNQLNDWRTVFLIHDKRFFSVLEDEYFLTAALNPDEIDEIKSLLVPTYSRLVRPDLWSQARDDKNHWIIKPSVLGKSIDVFAGCVTNEEEWRDLFASDKIDDMVLQPFIKQRKFKGSVRGNPTHDYVVGTLLFFDDHFFGPGLFRASSHPVTNKVDDRKLAPLVTADTQYFDEGFIL